MSEKTPLALAPADIAAIEAFDRERAEFNQQRSQLMIENANLRTTVRVLSDDNDYLSMERRSWRAQGFFVGVAFAVAAYMVGCWIAGLR